MDFKELDHMFDTLMERVDQKEPLQKGAYETHPQGQDHFLLNKSWNYFKERIKTVEEQNDQQLQAKSQEIEALQKELQIHKETAADLERKNSFLNAFQESFVKARHIDFVDFQKSQEKLNDVWEEERLKLENKTLFLEEEINKQKKISEDSNRFHRDRERMLQQALDEDRNKLFLKAQEENEKIKEFNAHLMEKEEMIQNGEKKIDLLREELHRNQDISHHLKEEIALWEKRADSLINKVEGLNRDMDARGQKIDQLTFKIDTIEKEKEELKRNWQREEASWRELWDRFRSMHEKPH